MALLFTTSEVPEYKVVVCEGKKYSIWPAYKANAVGWNDVGKQGTKVECLNYINQIWTDVRPAGSGPAKAASPGQAA